jgi:tetratricopeptide (TPR) repeat protein
MQIVRALVIPFGVPAEGRGLGLGLAALMHGFVRMEGGGIALAQLHERPRGESDAGPQSPLGAPVEAFIPPAAWSNMEGVALEKEVDVVITGAFEPPSEGRGMLQLLAFDARDGTTRARVEAHLDSARAGSTILAAFDEMCLSVGGELGFVRDIAHLSWDALESLLRAEACVLFDPKTGEPKDRLAAMLHLGRAVFDAPDVRFPAARLATVAFEAGANARDPKVAEAAVRALARAAEDAPDQLDLLEAGAALHAQLGNAEAAEVLATNALARAEDRPGLFAVIAGAKRARGDGAGAMEVVERGLARTPGYPPLLAEKGSILAARGDAANAAAAWREALAKDPLNPPAFSGLASLASAAKDGPTVQALVDQALAAPIAPPVVLRRAIQLVLETEPDGLHREARVARLARTLVSLVPRDPWASLVLANASKELGERDIAIERYGAVVALAAWSPFAAEAQRLRLALEQPQAALEIEAVLRAARSAPKEDLSVIAARAGRLAEAHQSWVAYMAEGIAFGRIEAWNESLRAFERAVGISPGATLAHVEFARALIAFGAPNLATARAESAIKSGGEDAQAYVVLAAAHLANREPAEAERAIARALALDPSDEAHRALAERIRMAPPPPAPRKANLLTRIRRRLRFW